VTSAMHVLLSALGAVGGLAGVTVGVASLVGDPLYVLGAIALTAIAGLFLVLSVADLGLHALRRFERRPLC
jgi:peptidoglycan/LPS O-acetylase OafA/YrhL